MNTERTLTPTEKWAAEQLGFLGAFSLIINCNYPAFSTFWDGNARHGLFKEGAD